MSLYREGGCSDVLNRALRVQPVDLQQLVHEDMQKRFYSKLWGLKKSDKNMDHRRGSNLELFFKRYRKNIF